MMNQAPVGICGRVTREAVAPRLVVSLGVAAAPTGVFSSGSCGMPPLSLAFELFILCLGLSELSRKIVANQLQVRIEQRR